MKDALMVVLVLGVVVTVVGVVVVVTSGIMVSFVQLTIWKVNSPTLTFPGVRMSQVASSILEHPFSSTLLCTVSEDANETVRTL